MVWVDELKKPRHCSGAELNLLQTSQITHHTRHKQASTIESPLMPSDQPNLESAPLLPREEDSTEPEQDFEHQETMSAATFWRIGAVFGATAVGLGAFGAHGLKNRISDPQKIANWVTAAQYQVCQVAVYASPLVPSLNICSSCTLVSCSWRVETPSPAASSLPA